MAQQNITFRILVGSYEHNLLCLSLMLTDETPVFQPIFHFEAHSLSIKSIDVAKRYLVTGSNDEHIRIYDLQKRKELGNLLGHQGTVTTLRFSNESNQGFEKSGKWLLSGSEDGKIIVWRSKDWEIFGTLKGHQDRVNDLDIHPSGRVAISVSKDHTVRLWNLMTAKKAAILKVKGRDSLGKELDFVRWSNSGDHFFVGMMDKIFVYETTDAKIKKKYNFKITLMCMEIMLINDKHYLVLGLGNGEIQFYDVEKFIADETETPEPEFSLRGHTSRIKGITLYKTLESSPYLVSVSSDGKIVVWDLSESVSDQIAVYDTGERLNCVAVCPETIEKAETMKKRHDPNEINEFSESEYETDGEEIRKVLKPKRKKNKKSKVSVTRE